MQDASTTNSTNSTKAAGRAVKARYPEINDIGSDLKALKSDVTQLASSVKERGLRDLSEKAHEGLESLQGLTEKMEKRIRERPGQSLALAFAGGLLASFFLGRK